MGSRRQGSARHPPAGSTVSAAPAHRHPSTVPLFGQGRCGLAGAVLVREQVGAAAAAIPVAGRIAVEAAVGVGGVVVRDAGLPLLFLAAATAAARGIGIAAAVAVGAARIVRLGLGRLAVAVAARAAAMAGIVGMGAGVGVGDAGIGPGLGA